MKLIKGKSYIFFGNFPNCEEVAKKLSEELGIEAKAFLSKTDTTSVLEYCDTDKELINLKDVKKELNDTITELKKSHEKLISDYIKLKEDYKVSKLETERWQDSNIKLKEENDVCHVINDKLIKQNKKLFENREKLNSKIDDYRENYSRKWFN